MKYIIVFTALIFANKLFAQPVITSFSPASGQIGTTVTISGNNFSATPANNIVFFGAVRANVTSASATSLMVTVPAGATYQPIGITSGGLTAFSNNPFVVTFTGGGNAFTVGSFDYPNVIRENDSTNAQALVKDLDGDGKPDFIYVIRNFNRCFVRKNTSTGTNISFGDAIELPSTAPSYYASDFYDVASEDVDNDGKPDVLLTNSSEDVVWVSRNISTTGNIAFETAVDFNTGVFPVSLATSDINNDGKADVIIANNAGNSISVLKNTSVTGTISFDAKTDFATGVKPFTVLANDFDGDGKTDVAVSTNAPFRNTIEVFRNNSSGGAISFLPKIDFVTVNQPAIINTGDFDLDGKSDLVISNGQINILKNISSAGNIVFQNSYTSANSILYNTPVVEVNDLNGDGKVDLLTSIFNAPPLVYKNISAGSIDFKEPVQMYSPLQELSGSDAAIADLDGDGKSDVIATGNATPTNWQNVAIARNKTNEVSIAAFTPISGTAGIEITITGANFTTASAVSFGGTPAASFTVLSSDSIRAVLGAGATGIVSVTTPLGTDTLSGFTYLYTPPVISSFTPTAAANGGLVTITGSDFYNVQSVSFGGKPAASFTVVNSTTITAVVQGGLSGDVVVTSITGQGSLSGFSYLSTVITSFSPASAITGDTIIIKGENFLNTNLIKLGNTTVSNYTVVADTLIRATVGNGASGYVYVSTPNGADSINGFIYVNTPQIDSFVPAAAIFRSQVKIHGSNFTGVNNVTFGGVPVYQILLVTDTTILVVIDAGATGAVKVINNLTSDSLAGFTFLNPPVVNSFSPTTAAEGDTVLIHGINFNIATGVRFGNVSALFFNVLADTLIKAVVGNGASGSVAVETMIAGANGAGSIPGFIFIPRPVINSIAPNYAGAGDTVVIYGSNFSNVSSVSFGNVPAANFTVSSSSTIHAVVANGATGYVRVITNGGVDSLGSFFYSNVPLIQSFTPVSGDTGTIVSINGSHFLGTTAVTFGGTPAISFTVVSKNLIEAMVSTGTTGSIKVTNPDGSDSAGTFTVLPYVSSVDLNMCANSNAVITSNFLGTTYQWQVDDGSGYVSIIANANYAAVTTRTLQLISIPSAWYGYKYRCFINGNHYSRQTVIKFSNTWTGGVSNEWENPANWSCGTVPDANTDVIITGGTVVVSSNVVVRSMLVNGGATYTVTAPNTVVVLGPNAATGTLGGTPGSCTPFTINGTYNQEVALNNSHSIQVQVNVTKTGPYAVTTNTVGGMTFYKTGTFTSTGLQTVLLQGYGTPGYAGNRNFNVNFGASNCTVTVNIIPVAPSYFPTTLNSNWSYDITSTPDPTDSAYIVSTSQTILHGLESYRRFNQNIDFSELPLDHRKTTNNYYTYHNDFIYGLNPNFISTLGEFKQLDENAAVGNSWQNNISGFPLLSPSSIPVRVTGTVLEKSVPVSFPNGLNFSNVIKVKLEFFNVSVPATPQLIQTEERWYAFGVGLIYKRDSEPVGGAVRTLQIKRYQVN